MRYFLLIILLAFPAYAVDTGVSEKWLRALAETSLENPEKPVSEKRKLSILKKVHFRYATKDYVSDLENYGVSDYWATRAEFLKNGGDCEDFAIAKYSDLLEAGFDDEDMRIAVIDNGEIHAVLMVRVGKTEYVLDNQNPLQLLKKPSGTILYAANQSSEHWYADGRKLLKERAVASPLRWK